MKSTRKMVVIPFEKYERLLKQKPQTDQSREATPQITIEEPVEVNSSLPTPDIISSLPSNIKKRGERLLTALNGVLKWNEKGEIIIDGEVIPFTHITDLIKDALTSLKTFDPSGSREFYRLIKSSNVPLSLIANPTRRKELTGGGDSEPESLKRKLDHPPPPGIPDKKPKPLPTKKSSWKSLWKTEK